jgi:hypothetical protein
MISTMYTTYESMTVNGPSGGTVTPAFITSMFGPKTTKETFTGILNLEFKVKGEVI